MNARAPRSERCLLAATLPEYQGEHAKCRQQDIPMPDGHGILLQRHCGCTCHNDGETT